MKRTIIILAECDAPEGVDVASAVRCLGDRIAHATIESVRVGRAEATSVDMPVTALVAAMEHAVKVIGRE